MKWEKNRSSKHEISLVAVTSNFQRQIIKIVNMNQYVNYKDRNDNKLVVKLETKGKSFGMKSTERSQQAV
jgi:hypothetical protein